MNVNNVTAVAIIAIVVVGLLLWGNCQKKTEQFTRTPLSNCSNCEYTRTPVDYAMKEGGFQKNPHWRADPSDQMQPLGYGPIDFYNDERSLANGTLYKEFDNDYVGGTGQPLIINDEKGRSSLREAGDETNRRILDNVRGSRYGPLGGIPLKTDMDLSTVDPYGPLYGGSSYLPQLVGK